ncbi:hypothetical protein E5Q_03957 [Mixia osmundae IAM 14324]|uniref:DNA polymerase lambda n=2 Tax=Mixia osmundae (strain CBS 9802 / IAM 14324 / JCM 22182 / KY 12970) TaxID=764103 RepID=G7E2T5_MIXOS|nr:hypothetical protein E5Q_03957 [Mixia osmundae IAM 14324]
MAWLKTQLGSLYPSDDAAQQANRAQTASAKSAKRSALKPLSVPRLTAETSAKGKRSPEAEAPKPKRARRLKPLTDIQFRRQFPSIADYAQYLATPEGRDSVVSLASPITPGSNDYLQGCHILLVGRTLEMTRTRRLHMDRIVQAGGTNQRALDAQTTHIVALTDPRRPPTDSKYHLTMMDVLRLLGMSSVRPIWPDGRSPKSRADNKIFIVDQEWLSECMEHSNRAQEFFNTIERDDPDAPQIEPEPIPDEIPRRGNRSSRVPAALQSLDSQISAYHTSDEPRSQRSPSRPVTSVSPTPEALKTSPEAQAVAWPCKASVSIGAVDDDFEALLEAARRGEDDPDREPDEVEDELDFSKLVYTKDLDSQISSEDEHAGQTAFRPRGRGRYRFELENPEGQRAIEGGPNEDICQVLDGIHDAYDPKDTFQRMGIRKAQSALRRSSVRIDTFDKAFALKGVGESNASKIVEIARTGNHRRLTIFAREGQETKAMLNKIYGVGFRIAENWYKAGVRTLDDLRTNPLRYGIKLNEGQQLGLQYYDELNQRMSRSEATQLYETIQNTCRRVDLRTQVHLMGSYRRGQPTCGDIDILVTRDTRDGRTHAGVIPRLLTLLKEGNIVRHDLSLPHDPNALDAKWMGLCSLPGGIHRRIDILGVPFEQLGAALIYFTGNDIFNRSLRLKARRMGYSLNQRGLYADLIRDHKTKLKVTEGHIIASATEEEIFAILKVPWRPPDDRLP